MFDDFSKDTKSVLRATTHRLVTENSEFNSLLVRSVVHRTSVITCYYRLCWPDEPSVWEVL